MLAVDRRRIAPMDIMSRQNLISMKLWGRVLDAVAPEWASDGDNLTGLSLYHGQLKEDSNGDV